MTAVVVAVTVVQHCALLLSSCHREAVAVETINGFKNIN